MKRVVYILFILIMAYSCRKPYLPAIVAANNNYLVVEGVLNSGTDSTFVKLTRTVKLADSASYTPELNATVTVQGNNNTSYPLQSLGGGLYAAPALGLSTNIQYRLTIQTSNGEQYLSDYVQAKDTPDIDSISFVGNPGGIQFYVNSHDPNNNTKYYRWDFEATYGYISFFQSYFKVGSDGYPLLRKDSSDMIYECYKTIQSQQILLGTSAKLAKDVINKQPIDYVPQSSGLISHGYSLLLRQYALTPTAYDYWQNLKKNTEQIGSIFDAQPSEIQGNIHCVTHPAEPVVGFISASSIKTKRIYVDGRNTGSYEPWYIPPPNDLTCTVNFIPVNPEATFKTRLGAAVARGDTVLINSVEDEMTGATVAYSYGWIGCIDCRVKAPFGNNVRPVFWPYGKGL
jgi:hypothetical protein